MASFDPIRLAQWCGGEWNGEIAGLEISGFTKDSRDVKPGEAYFALLGDNHDGHNFVDNAIDAGASCAIIGSGFAKPASVPVLVVKDTLLALQQMAREYRRQVAPLVVGVTGSSGKTTEKEMIAACLSMQSKTTATRGNWNNHIGLPMSLLAMQADTQTAVMEIGINHPGEMAPLCGILKPDWAVITNVGPVHLEYFGSVQAIAREKSGILKSLPDDGVAFLDSDSAYFDILADAVHGKMVTVSAKGDADYTYSMTSARCVEVRECSSGEDLAVDLPIPGLHIGYDAAMAVAVARTRQLSWNEIAAALSEFIPLAMRWAVTDVGGVKIINDAYNANPMSMRASMKAFADEECHGARWLVLGGMLELGESAAAEHLALGRWAVRQGFSEIITVGDLGNVIAEGAHEANGSAQNTTSPEEAADILKDELADGDAVLVKGSRGIALETTVELLEKYLNHKNQ